MSLENDIAGFYQTILGRAPDAAGLAYFENAVGAGKSYAQVRFVMATSPEAQGDLASSYQNELGRAPDSYGLSVFTQGLESGASLSSIQQIIGTGSEAKLAIDRIYNAELGRAPDQVGLQSYQQSLAGSSLTAIRASVANSPEAQADIANFYQTELGRAPDAAGLSSYVQSLASGGSLAAVEASIANSPEVAGIITSAYQSATGHGANAIELAAGSSELQSGIPLSQLESELGQLSGGTFQSRPFSSLVPQITPEIIGGPTPLFIYSVGNNDALVASKPESVFFDSGNTAVVQGFDPMLDAIEIQSSQADNFAALDLMSLGSQAVISFDRGPGTDRYFGLVIQRTDTAPLTLGANNFEFV